MSLADFVEKEIISKRFMLALVVIALFRDTPEVVAAVVFYYFGSHTKQFARE